MTAKEFLFDYINNHPDNKDENGNPYFSNITELFREIGSEYEYSEIDSSSRHWDNLFCVQKINNELIGYEWASVTGDTSIWDKGWEFNEDSVCYAEPYEVTEIRYRMKDA